MIKRALSQSVVAILAIAITFLITGEFQLSKFLISSFTIIIVVTVANLILYIINKTKRTKTLL